MSGGFSISSQLGTVIPTQYWVINADGNVEHSGSSTSPTAADWSVKSGILYNRGRQLYYDVQQNRLTIRQPVTTLSFPSPMVVEPCATCGPSNWQLLVTTVYPTTDNGGPLASFQTTIPSTLQTYKLPLIAQLPGVLAQGSYPTGGSPYRVPATNPQQAATRPFTATLLQVTPNGLVPITLTGLAPLTDLGSVVPGTTRQVNNAPATTGGSGWWPLLLYGALFVIAVILIFIVFSKKKTPVPLLQDPLVIGALTSPRR